MAPEPRWRASHLAWPPSGCCMPTRRGGCRARCRPAQAPSAAGGLQCGGGTVPGLGRCHLQFTLGWVAPARASSPLWGLGVGLPWVAPDAGGVDCLCMPVSLSPCRQPRWLIVDSLQGGSGEAFDWRQLRAAAPDLAQHSSHGWLLAGGLTPDTVAGALWRL